MNAPSARQITPEWLDELPGDDPRAIHSRRDLRRLNQLMGHAAILAATLRRTRISKAIRVVELGAGDGTFLLRLARKMAPWWRDVEAYLVDRQVAVEDSTKKEFVEAGWRAVPVCGDVFSWLESPSPQQWTVTIANLFLHHFADPDLVRLFEACRRRCELFVACEPRRAPLPRCAARFLGCIGCNEVTRHDAIASIRAGFRDRELSNLWPKGTGSWRLREKPAGLFSHCFSGTRIEPSDAVANFS